MAGVIKTNFTPIIDEVAQDVGLTGASVFGAVFRHCQMSRKVCDAALPSIAKMAHTSRRTVIRHLQILCDKKYIYDCTPNLRNKPHTYKLTDKAQMIISASGEPVPESHPEDEVTQSHGDSDTESRQVVPESHPDSDTESLEESSMKVFDESKKEEEYAPTGAPPQTPAQNDFSPEQDEPTLDEIEALLEHDLVKLRRFREEQGVEELLMQLDSDALEADIDIDDRPTPQSQDSGEQNSNGSAPRKHCPACQNTLNAENKCDYCLEHYGKNWIKHPAVVEHHERGHLWSRVVNRPRLIRIVGEDPDDVARFGDIVEEWSGRGYKPTNLHGMLSVFTEGWKHDNTNGKNGVSHDPLDELLASGVKIRYGH